MTTVKELIETLRQYDPDSPVIIEMHQSVEYAPLAGVGEVVYVAETTWSGYLVQDDENEDGEDDDPSYSEESEGVLAVLLWPVS